MCSTITSVTYSFLLPVYNRYDDAQSMEIEVNNSTTLRDITAKISTQFNISTDRIILLNENGRTELTGTTVQNSNINSDSSLPFRVLPLQQVTSLQMTPALPAQEIKQTEEKVNKEKGEDKESPRSDTKKS